MITPEELRRVPLFDGLSDGELGVVLERGEEKLVRAGEINGREGEPVEHLYVILDGELRITKKTADGGETVLNVYTAGNFFAEVPLLAGSPFLASGRALTDCRMFLVPNDLFRRLLSENAPFSQKILRTMAERVQLLQSVAGQREKLDSLGTLAAGLAHELNNPAAATRRSAGRLREDFARVRSLGWGLARAAARGELDPSALDALERAAGLPATKGPASPDALERSAREEELALLLEDLGLEDAWDLAPAFADAGLGVGDLGPLARTIPPGPRADALRYLGTVVAASGLLDEVESSAGRVSEIVRTMEGYSYMDRAPVQDVDINRSLRETVSVLGYKLGGIKVDLDLDPDLPRVAAYGGELNQVWTALLDNAADAVSSGGEGRVGVRTACEKDLVLVEVSDEGPGIPEDVKGRIFEPFFTTKDVGRGTGLGLDVTYRIVVGRHGGDIHVVSRPGDTRFEVRLPVGGPAGGGERIDAGWSLRAGR